MDAWFVCGPLEGRIGESRVLFRNTVVELAEASLTVLEGPSGAGKTTLLRAIAGLDPAPGARRHLAGRTWAPSGALAEWRSQVTWLAQDAPLLGGTVRDNLAFPFRLRAGRSRRFDPQRAGEMMDAVGLGGLDFERGVARLSGGERHRLALVRGLLWDPPVLLADEPLSGIDPERSAACWELIAQWARRPGHAALVVMHDEGFGTDADGRLRLDGGALRALHGGSGA
ncbi:MAG TPA: ATP-binding cassette domain-containing protein [Thiotrichales bacterium]|nr:ATP-binding cassette domain-containing protein [Thiotrichales bacterium]